MATENTRRIKDLDTLKALGHPLRMKLYRAISVVGTATASQLADQVDEAVSLVSYHLRKLAAHGLIEEAGTDRGDARERWWRRAGAGVSTSDADFLDAPERAAVHAAVSRMHARQRNEMYENYLDTQSAWPGDWRSAAFTSEYFLPLTLDELRRLGDELNEVLRRWQAHAEGARDSGDTDGRENVAVHTYGFPFRT
ncbi:helix-turn-helix domain-containing protein [Nonomuraea phyllanthi]|uniref:Helix-turn-helix domain-containing protein n=1 Tax=Nonomuraea phyllanthi TaxID=2219224 RepID=A0A5C4WV82_9ACTN|nr:helix-turn-helix domain-containing protein [Nonomuraea phyllanthi]KAB8197518.1 helix-turn-helix domain-containing protein [Nonomuraea phyllanthi]QFY06489.1 helix-turn-helix domain-containing protein [Nonomuraea phyllanthi]